MADVTVVGSIGIDTIETPYGKAEGVLGGSAVYAALAALSVSRRAARVAIVSVVGDDFPDAHRNFLLSQKIALDGLVTVNAPTFRWHGRYEFEMGTAQTVKTELGSLALADQVITGYQQVIQRALPDVQPVTTPGVATGGTSGIEIPDILCLANIDPDVQLEIASRFRELKVTSSKFKTKFIVLDTMNYWIEHKKSSVEQAIEHADCVVLNENEAREFFGTPNLIKAGHKALELGPAYVVIKKGEHGSMLFSEHGFFAVPGYPLLEPIDPTGAGDSFAGALVGYLAKHRSATRNPLRERLSGFTLVKQAVVYATAVSSFTVEGMATTRLANLKPKEIEERVEVFRKMRQF